MGKTILKSELKKEGIPVYSATQSDTILGYIDKSDLELTKGDLVIPARGNSIGCVTLISKENATCTQTTICSTDINFINVKYLYYCCWGMKNKWFAYIGSAIPQITVQQINENIVPVPPITEQSRIVEAIEKFIPYIEKYEGTYAKLEILNSNYKEELKKSILQYAIQGKLVKQDPNDESAEVLINKILDEKRELIKTKHIKKENLSVIYKDSTDNQFYEKFDDGKIVNITEEIPFEIPNNWCWIRFKNICKVITCGYASTPKYEINGIPFISAKNIKPYKFIPEDHKFISEELYRKLTVNFKPEINDILLTRVGAGIGEAAIVDQDFNFAIYVSLTLIKLVNYDFIYNKYILNYILSPFGVSTSLNNIYGKGASQGNLNVNNVRDFLVPIPPLGEQKKIVNKIEKLFNIL